MCCITCPQAGQRTLRAAVVDGWDVSDGVASVAVVVGGTRVDDAAS